MEERRRKGEKEEKREKEREWDKEEEQKNEPKNHNGRESRNEEMKEKLFFQMKKTDSRLEKKKKKNGFPNGNHCRKSLKRKFISTEKRMNE